MPTSSDAGSGADAQAVYLHAAESGLGGDGPSPDSYGSGAYSGGLYGSLSYLFPSSPDAGAAVEQQSAASYLSGLDSGSGADQQAGLLISAMDAGSGTGQQLICPSDADAGSGVDQQAVYLSDTDLGYGADAQVAIAYASGLDASSGTDAQALSALTYPSEAGSGAEQQAISLSGVSDSGVGSDGPALDNYGSGYYGGGGVYGSFSYVSISSSDCGAGADGAGYDAYSSGAYGTGSYGCPSYISVSLPDAGFGYDLGYSEYGGTSVSAGGSVQLRKLSAGGTGVVTSADSGSGIESYDIIIPDLPLAPPSIAFVQSEAASSGTSSVTSLSALLGTGIAFGNLVVACVSCDSSSAVISAPPGWTQAVVNQAAPPAAIETAIWYTVVTVGEAGLASFTFGSSISAPMAVSVAEFSSSTGWAAPVLDKTAQGNTQPLSAVSSSLDSGTTPLTALPIELWVASLAYGGSESLVPASGWTAVASSSGSNLSMSQLYQVASAYGAADCSASIGSTTEYWAGAVATFMPLTPVLVGDQDYGTGSDIISAPVSVLIADEEAALGAEGPLTAGTGVVPYFFPADAEVATGSELQQAPLTVMVPVTRDYGIGFEAGGARSVYVLPPSLLSVFEGFSLSRVSVLSSGAEEGQLYGAQSISIVPAVTASDMKADDDELGVWFNMNKAAITVINGFMSWSTLSLLSGLSISSSGTSPRDYYGLPLWTQYQHNRVAVPLAFRASARNVESFSRTLDFILYRVQLSVLDYTGVAYKQGLGVSYAGTVLFSSIDESGNALPSPQIGRVVSSPGVLTGAISYAYA